MADEFVPGANEPTEKQKSAGNYAKGHRHLHGMRFSIENAAGTIRRGVAKDGTPWETEMPLDYGYVRSSKGKDRDKLDVFFGPEADNPEHQVYVIDQDDDEGNFDEHKIMLGFPSSSDAYEGYHSAYPDGHQGFRAITALPMAGFRQWAGMGVAGGKRKRISELAGLDAYRKGGTVAAPAPAARLSNTGSAAGVHDPEGLQAHFTHAAAGNPDSGCGCGNGIQMPAERSSPEFAGRSFADGGAVDIDLEKPFFGSPMVGRRREDRQDRAGATEIPLQTLRGVVAGTLGFGGDMEGLGRTLLNLGGAGVDSTPTLPTGDFYQEALPLPPKSATGKAAGNAGSLAGVPLSAAALGGVRAAAKMAPAARGALTQIAENAMAPRQLSSQAGAVKLPGGNWVGRGIETAPKDARGWEAEGVENPVGNWMEKRVGKYLRNEMGTKNDPLIALEAEGKLHLTPEQLRDMPRAEQLPLTNGGNAYSIDDTSWDFHNKATGRPWKSAWEHVSDAAIEPMGARRALREASGRGDAQPWLQRLGNEDPAAQVYSLDDQAFQGLGFDHVRDYLSQATEAHGWRTQDPRTRELALGTPQGAEEAARFQRLMDRGLDVDPAKLNMMSLPDVVRKTSDWNKMLAEVNASAARNKGIKEVLKRYDDTGHHWAELDDTGLGAEGDAMGHCVGGYCDSVSSGQKRILSLRDAKGDPHVTVELAGGHKAREGYVPFEQLPEGPIKQSLIDKGITDSNLAYHPETGLTVLGDRPWSIKQIKGKGNKAPIAEYQKHVQDLIRNMGPWGDEIGDFGNSGLRGSKSMFNSMELEKLKSLGHEAPGSHLNPDEANEFQRKLGSGLTYGPDWRIKDDYKGYAQGGSINAGNTVGQATFNPSAQGVQSQGQAQPAQVNTGSGAGGTPGTIQQSVQGGIDLSGIVTPGAYGTLIGNGNPTSVPANYTPGKNAAPIYDVSNQDEVDINAPLQVRQMQTLANWNKADPALKATLGSGGQGWSARGSNAFLGAAYTPTDIHQASGAEGDVQDFGDHGAAMRDLAARMGYTDEMASKYEPKADWIKNALYTGGGGEYARQEAYKEGLDDYLKDYTTIGGLSAGWDGGTNMRGNATTMYKTVNGKMVPITQPRKGVAAENHGFWKSNDGRELLTAASMVLPAVGGWAGLAGQAAGTTGATVANVAGNTALGYIKGGNQGALTAAASGLGGAAGAAAGNAAGGYGSIGGQLGSQAGKYLFSDSQGRR